VTFACKFCSFGIVQCTCQYLRPFVGNSPTCAEEGYLPVAVDSRAELVIIKLVEWTWQKEHLTVTERQFVGRFEEVIGKPGVQFPGVPHNFCHNKWCTQFEISLSDMQEGLMASSIICDHCSR